MYMLWWGQRMAVPLAYKITLSQEEEETGLLMDALPIQAALRLDMFCVIAYTWQTLPSLWWDLYTLYMRNMYYEWKLHFCHCWNMQDISDRISDDDMPNKAIQRALEIISYIGVSLSIVGLMLTVIALIMIT